MPDPTTYKAYYTRSDSWDVFVPNTLDVPKGAKLEYFSSRDTTKPPIAMTCLYVKASTKGVGDKPDSCVVHAQRDATAKRPEDMSKAELLAQIAALQAQAK